MIVVTVPNSFIDFPWFQMVLTVHSASRGKAYVCVLQRVRQNPVLMAQHRSSSFRDRCSPLSTHEFCSCILFFEERKFYALSLE